ncbi:EpsG family protein [Providencia manganoxydans]|uniref:EpsG family protein n=1 Tax=Providencia manganoxydans TaxID=2923283 RepID=A0ABX7AED6_9GAMM|nr:EpsG family protein [Providencia manganoxydans]
MITLYSIFIFVAIGYLLQLFNIIGNNINDKLLLLVVAYLLILLAGLNTTSNDYREYIDMFMRASMLPLDQYNQIHGEFFFLAITGFIYNMFGSHEYVFVFIATISIFITFYIIFKDSQLAFLSILIYLSHAFLNKEMIQIRAGITSAIVLFAISMQAKGQKWNSLLLILLSGLFHSSGFIAIIPHLICRFVKDSNQVKLSYCLITLACVFYILDGFKLSIPVLQSLGLLSDSVQNYLVWDEYNYDLGILNPNTVKQLIVLILAMYYFNENKFYATYYCYFYIGISWLIAFSSTAIIAARVSSILSVSELILIPAIVLNAKKNRIILGCFFLFLYSAMFIINIEYKEIIKNLELGVF